MLALSAMVLSLGSCDRQNRALPPPPATLDITMGEYRFEMATRAPEGRAVLEVRNIGTMQHHLTLHPLPKEFPALDRYVANPSIAKGTVLPTTALLLARQPGSASTFSVDLERGRYALFCGIRDPDGITHVEKGMYAELHVS